MYSDAGYRRTDNWGRDFIGFMPFRPRTDHADLALDCPYRLTLCTRKEPGWDGRTISTGRCYYGRSTGHLCHSSDETCLNLTLAALLGRPTQGAHYLPTTTEEPPDALTLKNEAPRRRHYRPKLARSLR